MVSPDEYTRYVEYWEFTGDEIKDIPRWRKDHAIEFPILSTMALNVLSTPGMSTEAERVFSDADRSISDARYSLGEGSIMACLIQYQGLKTGLFIQ